VFCASSARFDEDLFASASLTLRVSWAPVFFAQVEIISFFAFIDAHA
jgi:hypothetical protein